MTEEPHGGQSGCSRERRGDWSERCGGQEHGHSKTSLSEVIRPTLKLKLLKDHPGYSVSIDKKKGKDRIWKT